VIRAPLERLDAEAVVRERLRSRLTRLLAALEGAGDADPDLFLEAIEGMTMFERYYTPDQLAELEQRRDAIGEEGMKRAESDWAALIAEAEALRADGVEPSDPRARAVAKRWSALVEQFTGGNPAIRRSLQQMYETEGVDRASRGAVSPDLMHWIGAASTD
jgi:hypothetical protein